jgi:hypothetical protein
MSELLPCPFAHIDDKEGQPPVIQQDGSRVAGFMVRCPYCEALGPWAEDEAQAALFWNTRKREP